jgi:hypothetical protein
MTSSLYAEQEAQRFSIGAMSKGVEFGYAARSEMPRVVVVVVVVVVLLLLLFFLLSIQLCQLGRTSAALQPHQASRT